MGGPCRGLSETTGIYADRPARKTPVARSWMVRLEISRKQLESTRRVLISAAIRFCDVPSLWKITLDSSLQRRSKCLDVPPGHCWVDVRVRDSGCWRLGRSGTQT
jgi:hypothetical protein